MKAEGADYDIHLVWNIKELINKVGPEKAIRELKKRCEAGAIIGCTLYKRLIEQWLAVALNYTDNAGRGPAEQFMAAAGEDEWVRRVEKLHEEFPNGIPRSKQLDLIDEFNTNLERKVGRGIPLEPGDATEEDIKESKRVVGLMARQLKVTPPKEKETPPAPPKEKEKPRPEPVRAAPEEPIIPVPRKPGMKAPELDLMKQEIEERIARMRAEKARGELKAGEKITDLPYEERRKLAKQIAATYPKCETEGIKIALDELDKMPKEKRIELAKKIASGELEIREKFTLPDTDEEEPIQSWARWALIVDYTQKHGIDKWLKSEYAAHLYNLTEEELKQLSNIIKNTEDLTQSERRKIMEIIANKLRAPLRSKDYSSISYTDFVRLIKAEENADELKKLYSLVDTLPKLSSTQKKLIKDQIKTRLQTLLELEEYAVDKYLGRPPSLVGTELREDAEILTEPRDYTQWTFSDFEGLLPGLESVEDLEEMYEQVGASEVISDSDKESLRNLIKARIDVVKQFYTEWAAREGK